MGNKFDFKEFAKLEIKIGTVIEAERVPGTDRLIKIVIDFGDEKRQVVAGFGHLHKPEELIGKQVPVVLNIKEAEIKGVKSQGIFLAIDDSKATLLIPESLVENGSQIK
jgi:methionine--tRNA ligase beta chain